MKYHVTIKKAKRENVIKYNLQRFIDTQEVFYDGVIKERKNARSFSLDVTYLKGLAIVLMQIITGLRILIKQLHIHKTQPYGQDFLNVAISNSISMDTLSIEY